MILYDYLIPHFVFFFFPLKKGKVGNAGVALPDTSHHVKLS